LVATVEPQTTAKFRWSPERERAAILLATDDMGEMQIAETVGVHISTLWRWRQHPEFAARVGDHVGQLQASMLRYRIAKKRERIKDLNALYEKQLAVVAERAADPTMADVPGGSTGLMVRQLKVVGTVTVEEYAVDTALLKEIRGTQEQAAKELGQWVERGELGVTVGVVRLIGVDPGDV
jgi:hypothetical protein